MAEIKDRGNFYCAPDQTGICFEYDGQRYAWGARGWRWIGQESVRSIPEERVPRTLRDLVAHFKTFSLEVRVDNLAEWLGDCEFCNEEYRVSVSAKLDYHASRRVTRICYCGTERYLVKGAL